MNYLRTDDIKKLTNNDVKKLEKEIDDLKEFEGDKRSWILDNIELINKNKVAKSIISDKVLAGQMTMKLFRVKYLQSFESTKKVLESKLFNYNNINYDNKGKSMFIYSTLYIRKNTYLIRIKCSLGKRTYLGNEVDAVKFVDAIYHTDKNIIEVRSDHKTSSKIIKLLETQLFLSSEVVNILEKHKNIEEFSKSINGRFKKISSNTSIDISELNEEDSIALGNMVIALDEYLIDKDENTFLEKIKEITFENDKLTFSYAFLAGCKQIGITVSDDSNVDVLNQGLYKVLNKHLSSDNGYILLSEDNEEYTIKVSTKTNTIRFISSVKESVVNLVIDNMISNNNDSLDIEDAKGLANEIESFISSKAIKSFRPEGLIEKFRLSNEVVSQILNKYIEKELIKETLELVSPDSGIVIKEINSIEEINNYKDMIYNVYKIDFDGNEENIVDIFIENFNEYIYCKYTINQEKIDEISESKIENTEDIYNLLLDRINDNDSIFIDKSDTPFKKIKSKFWIKKKKAS